MVFLNPARPGRFAEVSQVIEEEGPLAPDCSGCERPENTVKSLRSSFSTSRYGEGVYSRPVSVGKKKGPWNPRVAFTAMNLRGVAALAADAAKAGVIASSSGRLRETP